MSRPVITGVIVFEKLPEPSGFLQPIMTKEFNNEDDAENWINNILSYENAKSECKYTWSILFGVQLSHGDFERSGRGTISNVRSD
jgi:hypothetical protein